MAGATNYCERSVEFAGIVRALIRQLCGDLHATTRGDGATSIDACECDGGYYNENVDAKNSKGVANMGGEIVCAPIEQAGPEVAFGLNQEQRNIFSVTSVESSLGFLTFDFTDNSTLRATADTNFNSIEALEGCKLEQEPTPTGPGCDMAPLAALPILQRFFLVNEAGKKSFVGYQLEWDKFIGIFRGTS